MFLRYSVANLNASSITAHWYSWSIPVNQCLSNSWGRTVCSEYKKLRQTKHQIEICFYFVLFSVVTRQSQVFSNDTSVNLQNISIFQTRGKSGTATIVPFPLCHATIISRDYKVSLEKLGQNNLVHCPQKLELPFLSLSFPPIGFICSSVCQEEHATNQANYLIGLERFHSD